jgi:hypothetical protein
VTELVYGGSYPNPDRGTWSGTGDISYVYNFYSDGVLILSQGPYPYTDEKGGTYDGQPTYGPYKDQLFTTIRLEVVATDSVGSTSAYTELKLTEAKLNAFLANSRISGTTQVNALEYLQKALITNDFLRDYSSYGTILDYYPFAGSTDFENMWSLGKANEYLTFNGNWTHSANGSQANNSSAISSYRWNSPTWGGLNFSIGAYVSNEVTENSIDLSLSNESGDWGFGIKRDIGGGATRAYFTRPFRIANSSISMSTSVGLFEMYYWVSITINGSYDNYVQIFDGSTSTSNGAYLGQFNAPAYTQNRTFKVGGDYSTKNFQFAYTGWGSAANSQLKSIIQTYNSMLGR